VVAAADGEVVYSGTALIGYGELIIIKHSDTLLSAYAHNRVRLVSEGVRVRGGQPIAEMGISDRNEQLLHFEIRRNGQPVNPVDFLPRR
jgi:lipoprotein NlpD